MTDYTLRCLACGKIFPESDLGFRLECDEKHPPALLRADYREAAFAPDPVGPGLFRFAAWLPIRRRLAEAPETIIFHSEKLSRELGLPHLAIAFNGYWPERGAAMRTASFKELEAAAVLARLPANETRTLVVASAGNTGRAFLEYGSRTRANVLVVAPEFALPVLWTTRPRPPQVKLAILRDADYFDAIELSNRICRLPGFMPEGGAKNVARRDGMGCVMLSAAAALGRLPDHYFQAVGSGTGAIAAWEMAERLIASGHFGQRRPSLHLAQNTPFTIMTDAWENGSRQLPALDPETARQQARAVYAPVLSNRNPPYALTGGLFDALSASGGTMYRISADAARAAGQLFSQAEGIDLDPAAEVALATLQQAVTDGRVASTDHILLNLTGGGAQRLAADGACIPARPDHVLTHADLDEARLRRLFSA